MKCNTCGKEIKDKMLFCPYCNSKQEITGLSETPSIVKPIVEQKTAAPSLPKPEETKTEVSEETDNDTVFLDNLIIDETDEWIIADSDECIKSEYFPTEEQKEETVNADKNKPDIQNKNANSGSKRKQEESRDTQEAAHSKINKDGYYDPVPPSKKEEFPFLKGEFIAKVLFMLLTVIVLALFLIYFI